MVNKPTHEELEQTIVKLEKEINRLKLADEVFQENESFNISLLAESPYPLLVVNTDTSIKYVNPIFEKLTGYSLDKVIGLKAPYPWWIAGDPRTPTVELREKYIFEGIYDYETVFRTKDGQKFWVQINTVPIDGLNGGVKYSLTQWVNITERKQAENELEKRLKYERMLREVSEKAVLYNDREKLFSESLSIIGEALDVNRIYIFEHNHLNETVDNTFEWCAVDIFPQKEQLQGIPSKDIQWWVDTLRENEIIRYSDIEMIPDEKVKDILRPQHIKSILVVPLFLKDKYFGFIGFDECFDHREWVDDDVAILQSTTQILSGAIVRLQAESALRESEATMRSIFRVAPIGIGIVVDRILHDVNTLFSTITGYSRNELIGKSSRIVYPTDEDYEYVGREKYKQIQEKGTGTVETTFKRKDGKIIDVILSSTPLDPNDPSVGVAFTVLDITDRKKLEEHLLQAQKMESIGTLAGGIAHDFNNILSPIMIHSEMAMIDLPSDSLVQHNLKEIFKAGERARDMVKQILAFSRKGEGKLIAIKITPILNDVLKMLRSSIPTTIEIKQNLDAESDTVLADPTQIHQIMLNLGTNSAHAMREKGGILEVSLVREELDSEMAEHYSDLTPGSYLKLTVRDSGSGIDDEIMQKIFEPYFTTKQIGEGTGMGLALVHGIVKSYGGDITVESEVGSGTTFNIYLPGIVEEVASLSEPAIQLPKGSERILFVDDELSAVNAMQSMLENLGYNVTARTSSIEALEAFKDDPTRFDLIITDMTMPEMTGKELAREIMLIRSGMPVILCTGFSEQIDEGRAKEMGISGYLMKPIVMYDMASTIRGVLD